MKITAVGMASLMVLAAVMPVKLTAQAGPEGEQPAQAYAPVVAEATMTDEVKVRYWIDRTALFAGDQVNYHLQIHCADGVDLLTEDLDPAGLNLTGLELVSSEQHVSTVDGTRIYHVRYTLTSYDLNTPSMQIGALTIRYYAGTGGSTGARSPAGEITLPAAQLSLRSALATAPMQSRLRDTVASEVLQDGTGWIATTGWLLLLFSGAPVGWWAAGLVRNRAQAKQKQKIEQAVVAAEKETVDRLRGLLTAADADRRQGYDELDRLMREILSAHSRLNAGALTPAELGRRLAVQGLGVPVEQLIAVLEDCDRARYGRPAQIPAADRFDAGVELARTLLTAR